jgi:hypothetical protein
MELTWSRNEYDQRKENGSISVQSDENLVDVSFSPKLESFSKSDSKFRVALEIRFRNPTLFLLAK